jgi:hypothetical protein
MTEKLSMVMEVKVRIPITGEDVAEAMKEYPGKGEKEALELHIAANREEMIKDINASKEGEVLHFSLALEDAC